MHACMHIFYVENNFFRERCMTKMEKVLWHILSFRTSLAKFTLMQLHKQMNETVRILSLKNIFLIYFII